MPDSNPKSNFTEIKIKVEDLKNKLVSYIKEKRTTTFAGKPNLNKEKIINWNENEDVFFKMSEEKQINFLEEWRGYISTILDIKAWEDVQVFQKNDNTKKLKLDEMEKFSEILTPFLKIANKNRHDKDKKFEDYKKENEERYYCLAVLRVMSYWIRAYAYFALGNTHRGAHKISRPELFRKALSDLYKALRILERDRDQEIHDVFNLENGKKIKRKFQELEWDWCIYLGISILKGETYYRRYDYAHALDCYCKSLRLYRNTACSDNKITVKNHEIAVVCYHKGSIFLDRGEFREAIKWLLKALLFIPVDKELTTFTMFKKKIEKEVIGEIDNIKIRKRYKKDFFVEKFIKNPDFLIKDFKEVTEEYKTIRSRIFNRLGFAINTILQTDETIPNIKWFEVGYELDNSNYLCLHNIYRFIPKNERKKNLQKYHDLLKDFIKVGEVGYSEFPQVIASYTMYKSVFKEVFVTTLPTPEVKCKENMLAELLANIDNIADRPEIFYQQFACERKIDEEKVNKLIILKKWSSFTPNIPRPTGQRIPERIHFAGGGYFLIWNNKGIVIDPGFNYVENLYYVGYSIADIDAVIITHAHTDHTNDIEKILTLLRERNEYFKHKGSSIEKQRKIDVILNIGSMQKYLPWVSKQMGETIKRIIAMPRYVTNHASDTKGKNFMLDLKEHGYGLTLEITHAKHDEIISDNTAVGLKFNLYNNPMDNSPTIKVGFTSDTGKEDYIIEQYIDCDLLVLHLGDTNYKGLIDFANLTFEDSDIENISSILKPWEKEDKAMDFMKGQSFWLGAREELAEAKKIEEILRALFKKSETSNKNHLSFQGVFDFVKRCKSAGNIKAIIVGEFPEYLGSLRDKIAACLNEFVEQNLCFSGDVGMELGLYVNNDKARKVEIQCSHCALDNDLNSEEKFHNIGEIREILVRASGQAMLYLCERHKILSDEFIEKK